MTFKKFFYIATAAIVIAPIATKASNPIDEEKAPRNVAYQARVNQVLRGQARLKNEPTPKEVLILENVEKTFKACRLPLQEDLIEQYLKHATNKEARQAFLMRQILIESGFLS